MGTPNGRPVIPTGACEESLDFARDRLRGVEESAPQRR